MEGEEGRGQRGGGQLWGGGEAGGAMGLEAEGFFPMRSFQLFRLGLGDPFRKLAAWAS